jgi:uncharacterized protein
VRTGRRGTDPVARDERRGRVPRKLVRFAFSHPRLVVSLWALVLTVALIGIPRLRIETTAESVLDRESSAWRFYQHALDDFGGDEVIVVALESLRPFDPDMAAKTKRLSQSFAAIHGVRRVDSLATAPLIIARGGGAVSLDPALGDWNPLRTAGRDARLRDRLDADWLAPNHLVSEDGKVFAINLLIEAGAEERYGQILHDIEHTIHETEAWVSGVPVFRFETNRRTRAELLTFIPATVGLISCLLLLMFGSFRTVAVAVVPGTFASIVALGVMAWTNVAITISTVILPSVLLALGCAYSIHMICAAERAHGTDQGSLAAECESVATAVALSGLTTALGFLGISVVTIEAIREIGVFGALGVLVAVTSALTVCPLVLREWRHRSRIAWIPWRHSIGTVVAGVVTKRGGAIVVTSVVLVGVGALGVQRLNVETDVIEWFEATHPVRVSYEAVREKLSGISPINVVIDAPAGRSVVEPAVVGAIRRFDEFLAGEEEIGKVLSIAGPLIQLHKHMLGRGEEELLRDPDLIEQYLLLLESKEQTRDLLTADRARTNVILRVNNNGSGVLLDVARRAEAWWDKNGEPDFSVRATGIMYEFARAEDAIALGQIRGLAWALAAIATVLLAVWRSVRLAVVALIPNAVPVALVFGIMGWFGIALDAGTVLVGNLALGIAVDDTIHVVNGLEKQRYRGTGFEQGIAEVVAEVGRPLLVTTFVVAGGFLVLGLSGFTFTRHLGLLTASVLVLCLVADGALLPVLYRAAFFGRARRRG